MAPRTLRAQHTIRYPGLIHQMLKERAVLMERTVNGETELLLVQELAKDEVIDPDDYGLLLHRLGIKDQAKLLKPVAFRIPIGLSSLIQRRAALADHSFNEEVNRLLATALGRQRIEDDELIRDFKEKLQRMSQPRPELPDGCHYA